MSHFEILLPFGLPTPHLAPDLLRELRLTALSTLLAKAKTPLCREFDPFSRMLPHEAWLSSRFGQSEEASADNSPPLAVARMKSLGLTVDQGTWFIVQPVHIHIARDHLVLTDSRRSPLSEAEARALFDSVLPLFESTGKTLRYGNAAIWFLRADDWQGLQTATPDAACGHNVDIWMPKGEGARAWRKLQNEVQMEWHEHAVNLARADRGLPPVNSLWLWGAADANQPISEQAFAYSGNVFVGNGGIPAVGEGISSLIKKLPHSRLLVLNDLSEAALAEDWAVWLEQMHALESTWFAPLLLALQAEQLTQVKLIIGHHAQLREFVVSKIALLKFWAKPSLARLLP